MENRNHTRTESFKIAFEGLWHAIKSQNNFQIELVIGLLVIIAAVFAKFSRTEWLVLILVIALVLMAELINTVLEVVVDLAVKEQLLPDAKIAKDVSAAAVLLVSFFAVIVGLLLFIPHIF